MKIIIFANKMPDLCGAFLHDLDLGTELLSRGHSVVFLTILKPPEGYQGGSYRGFRYLHFSAGETFLTSSQVWITPHSPILPAVRRLNARGYLRPIVATCHFDGNYGVISGDVSTRWSELLFFINRTMEPNYRKNIVPWPPSIVETDIIRPILHHKKIIIDEPFEGDMITLVNANQNKGVVQFIDIARKMPSRKFLGVLPYYGELRVPEAPSNIEWVPFQEDIRNVLQRTRILLIPSFYESFGRIAVEALVNGIPVIYSARNPNSKYPGGSTEGMCEWIGDVAFPCNRENVAEWVATIEKLDDTELYTSVSARGKEHIQTIDIFNEAPRIASKVEAFSQKNPVRVTSVQAQAPLPSQQQASPQTSSYLPKPPSQDFRFSLSSGRLRLNR